ncbi:MAG: hypothetical protein R8K47_00515 [Mariprofundaceae bacterium]
MRICYTIDALNARGDKAWRLREDGSWRDCTYAAPIVEGDWFTEDPDEAAAWQGQRLKRARDGRFVRKGRPGVFDFWMRGIFAHAVPHHLDAPAVPEFAQMLDTIRGLEPGRPWLLYLDPEGRFRAIDTSQSPIIGNLDIAVRGEIASGSEWVGPDAVGDETRMDELWRQFLAGWLEHLRTHRLGVFVPDVERLKPSAEDYLAEFRDWRPERGEA